MSCKKEISILGHRAKRVTGPCAKKHLALKSFVVTFIFIFFCFTQCWGAETLYKYPEPEPVKKYREPLNLI